MTSGLSVERQTPQHKLFRIAVQLGFCSFSPFHFPVLNCSGGLEITGFQSSPEWSMINPCSYKHYILVYIFSFCFGEVIICQFLSKTYP